MKISLRLFNLLALLIVGSASILAEEDPFGEFEFRLYQGNMNLTTQIVQNGEVVTDAIVAVYCGEELRGKTIVGKGTNPNLAYLTIFGDYTQEPQYLYFKVYTNGIVFTYNPDPALTYEFYGEVGSDSKPYVITLPLSLPDDADNGSVLTDFLGQTTDVVLAGRTLYCDGNWNTLCLPFGLTETQIAASPLAGATLMTLDGNTSSFDATTGTLTLNFTSADAIMAGVPYIAKWNDAEDITNPVFTAVTIANTLSNVATSDGTATFTGSYATVAIGSTGDNTKLFLGAGNTLYYPNAAMNINAFRAYFQLNGITAGDPANPANGIKGFVLNFGEEETGIQTIGNGQWTIDNEGTYDLSGRKIVNGKWSNGQMPKGMYIYNGRKFILK